MTKLEWTSERKKQQEWEFAKAELEGKPDGTKLRRKGYKKITHSFIKINNTVYAMAGKGKLLGLGASGKVKLVEDEQGKVSVVKIAMSNHFLSKEKQWLDQLGRTGTLVKRHDQTAINIRSAYYHRDYTEEYSEVEFINKHYLLMDYLGVTLSKKKYTHRRERLSIAREIVDAVNALHEEEIYHNDIKPDNIVVNDQGKLNLIDFETAGPEMYEFDWRFAAPEAQKSKGKKSKATKATDTYATGKTLQTVLTSKESKHIASLMCAREPGNRPPLDVVSIGLTVEAGASQSSKNKAIAALLAASTQSKCMINEDNLKKCNNPIINKALATLYDYYHININSGFSFFRGETGLEATINCIKRVIESDDHLILDAMQEWSTGSKKSRTNSRASFFNRWEDNRSVDDNRSPIRPEHK